MNTNFSALEIRINIAGLDEEFVSNILRKEFGDFLLSKKITKYSPSYGHSKGRNALRKILLKRDGDLCYWCRNPMLLNADHNHPKSCSIEHLQRRSEGGNNSLDNLVLAHKVCNNERHKGK